MNRSSHVVHGAALTFETLVAGDGDAAVPVRMAPDDETLVRVVAGVVRLTIDGDVRRLGAGDEVVIPAGTPHRLTAAEAEARLLSGLRPARR